MQNNNAQLRWGSILSYGSLIIGYLIQIIYTPIMIRIIGQSQYGLYNLTNSIVSYLSLFSLGFQAAYVRFYMRHKSQNDDDGIRKLNGMFMVVFILLGIMATVTGMILVFNSSSILGRRFSINELHLAKKLMALMVVNIAISFPLIPIVSYIQAKEKFIFQNGLNIIRQILNPFMALPLLLLGYGSLGMVCVTTLISFGIGIWQLVYSLRQLQFKISFHDLNFSELREVAVFSSFIFLNAITDQINWNVDKFIIGRYYGAILVAIYGISAQLNSYYLNFSTAISNVYIPRINRIVADGGRAVNDKLTDLFIKIGRAQFMIVTLILIEIIFVGRPFIGFWAGKSYYASYPILLVLIIPVTIPLIQNAGIAIQQAKNMHIFRSVTYFIIAILNVGLSLIFVKPFGPIGTAWATAISLIIGNGFMMNWYYKNRIGLNIKAFWNSIIKLCPAPVMGSAIGILCIRTFNTYKYSGFIISGLIIALVYLMVLFLICISPEERRSILTKIKIIK